MSPCHRSAAGSHNFARRVFQNSNFGGSRPYRHVMGRAGGRGATVADPHLLHLVEAARLGQQSLQLVSSSQLSGLWAGYGQIMEATATDEAGKSHQLIVKEVSPPPGESGVGHDRKLHSYQVEAYFYQHLAPRLQQHPSCHIPQPLLVQSSLSSRGGGAMALVLTDLRPQFPAKCGSLSLEQTKAVLSWLAGFHATFWEQPTPAAVWEDGCYWHLSTRLEEYEDIGRDWADLKAVAHEVDRQLRGEPPGGGERSTQFRTLLHGDIKSANILFSQQGGGQLQCACYDFQYCGGGYGMKDVVYLLASSVSASVVQQHEEELLDYYHTQLCSQLSKEQAAAYTAQVMQRHWRLAVLDYVRFMAGWGWWGNVSWAKRKAREYLSHLCLTRSGP